MAITLNKLEIENIRGFEYAQVNLDDKKYIFVGPNNSGKTSLLLILNWIFNQCDLKKLKSNGDASEADLAILLPARETRNRARRISLYVKFSDKRQGRRYECDENGIARIRIGLHITPDFKLFLQLGDPKRTGGSTSDDKAIALLHELRSVYEFRYIPSSRDANSPRFKQTLLDSIQALLSERGLHSRRGGAPAEYRQILDIQESLETVAAALFEPLKVRLRDAALPGMLRDAELKVVCEPVDIVHWMSTRSFLTLTTGDHDIQTVDPDAVGSGLQSLLDLSIKFNDEVDDEDAHQIILAVEEPEAFLHPSAQRTLFRKLLNSRTPEKLFITTHSTILVEEAKYSEVTIVKNRRFYPPNGVDDNRNKINSALLRGHGAEMLFASSVLLVEGEGDRQFFEQLRRRLAKHDGSGAMSSMYVVPVGSKNQFAPWIRLLESYTNTYGRPIEYMVLADSDASTDIRRAFRDAEIRLPQEIVTLLDQVAQSLGEQRYNDWAQSARDANRACGTDIRIRLLPPDLEFAMLSDAPNDYLRRCSALFGYEFETRNDFLKKLGSKYDNGRVVNEAQKAPWLRGIIGESISPDHLSGDITDIVRAWCELTIEPRLFTQIHDSFVDDRSHLTI